VSADRPPSQLDTSAFCGPPPSCVFTPRFRGLLWLACLSGTPQDRTGVISTKPEGILILGVPRQTTANSPSWVTNNVFDAETLLGTMVLHVKFPWRGEFEPAVDLGIAGSDVSFTVLAVG